MKIYFAGFPGGGQGRSILNIESPQKIIQFLL